MKLVAREAETDALTEWLRDRPVRVTSVLAKVEVLRAARRVAALTHDDAAIDRATGVIAAVATIAVADAIAERASALAPPALRTLEAVHLASAMLAGSVEAFVAYDDRLSAAARAAGFNVVQPGRSARQ